MSGQRSTFAKRQREMELKDKAKAKDAKRAMRADRKSDPNMSAGPQIAWDLEVRAVETIDVPMASLVPQDDRAD